MTNPISYTKHYENALEVLNSLGIKDKAEFIATEIAESYHTKYAGDRDRIAKLKRIKIQKRRKAMKADSEVMSVNELMKKYKVCRTTVFNDLM